ncbi:hypothetical protein FT663_01960 [Candidozyma haemuli var. vulneris]|uniref:Uncharacterized protein n=1 Tax=Candidozyma haemuli TaxID=45357 RepID=A0A2V1ATC3_9ASCO|nr:hypothetical protein CXQ85_000020 [[Candida] haemuloni]KAF3988613.1 hypothetical protein FT662_03292 [[Candida] haemuloni var. vulneris]KAF3993212.1 hypothetical protein FT663_01960 [[Candida] haemuloni var. vulneris]PVH21055.1 hypothetical protein CXQ85_000020 [[Candida] haemuloni]
MLFKSVLLFTGLTVADSITGCHYHGATYFCQDTDGSEGFVTPGPTASTDAPDSYTDCHLHGAQTFCIGDDDEHRFILGSSTPALSTSSGEFHPDAQSGAGATASDAIENCHFHGEDFFCEDHLGNHGEVSPAPTASSEAEKSYTGCHAHGTGTFCFDSESSEVEFFPDGRPAHSDEWLDENTNLDDDDDSSSSSAAASSSGGSGGSSSTDSDDAGSKAGFYGAAGFALLVAGLF